MPKNCPSRLVLNHCSADVHWLEDSTSFGGHSLLANRRAARLEEIEAHGRPVTFRKAIHKSKKVYDRKALKRQASDDGL